MTDERPGSLRPGGRTARVREAVLRAGGDLLVERGFAHLDLTEVATRAGVGKTTVYRRWRTPAGLVADILTDMAETSLPHADTGTLLGDLLANATLVAETLTHPRQGPLFKSLIAAATCDEEAARALRHFYDTRLTEWTPCVERAKSRAEIPPETNPRTLLKAVSAPLYYNLLTTGDPITPQSATTAAHSAHQAALLGLYT
ncbi:TetR/AcrR family transcriptional regulator [Nocardia sp. NPDC003482]